MLKVCNSTLQRSLAPTTRHQLLDVYGHRNGHRLTRWCSLDAVVLKAITIALGDAVQKHMSNCYHVKGTGGIKAALRTVNTKTKSYRYVVKSDIADFYASMDHDMVIEQCKKVIKDKRILAIIQQYMNRVEVKAGVHNLIERGIVKGCPLSPIMGALVLKSLDKMIPSDCAYVRYMDDWVIMTKTRGRLRRVIKKMHRIVQGLKFKLAWDKTFIAKIGKGFDFLGYRFNQRGLMGLAAKSYTNHYMKIAELYEQGASDQRIGYYVTHWRRWVTAGLGGHYPDKLLDDISKMPYCTAA